MVISQENMAHGTLILRNWDALILMQAMQLAQAVRDDVVGAQRDALLADLHLQMDSIWTAYGQHIIIQNTKKTLAL